MAATAHTLTKDTQQQVATELQPVLASLIDLALQGKQAHWNVVGPRFMMVHEQLDKFVDDLHEWSDEVAERLRALEFPAEGQAGTVIKQSSLQELPSGAIPDHEVVKHVATRIAAVAAQGRAVITRLDPIDHISQDVVSGIVKGLEKHLWMFGVQQG